MVKFSKKSSSLNSKNGPISSSSWLIAVLETSMCSETADTIIIQWNNNLYFIKINLLNLTLFKVFIYPIFVCKRCGFRGIDLEIPEYSISEGCFLNIVLSHFDCNIFK